MAHFNYLPVEILELIFDNLDFRSRRNLTLVCQRWNAVLLSERFVTRNVMLSVDGNRMLDPKLTLIRCYPNLALRLDGPFTNESFKSLRASLPSLVPSPRCVRLNVAQSNDPRWIAVCEEQFFSLRMTETFHLVGSWRTELRRPILLRMDNLRTLKLEVVGIEEMRLRAPNLCQLHLVVHSEEHLDFLLQFIHQLHSLSVVFSSKESYYFYNLKLTKLRHLSIDRRFKGMTKSEQNISIAFFKRCEHLQRLELIVKFIDSYVLHTIAEKLTQLVELTLQVSEGTIELGHIAKLVCLERLRIVACRVNLQDVSLPALEALVLGSAELGTGTYLEGIECLMAFTRLRSLSLVNVKIYPEVLQLTPSYSVERMIISHYKRFEENHLLILLRRFPAVRWLRISNCHGLYQREIDKLKRMLPKLAVAFDEAKSDRL